MKKKIVKKKKELTVLEQIEKILSKKKIFNVLSIENVNHKPHVYMIGPRHLKYAGDHHSSRLGEETMRNVQCCHPRCTVSFEEHTSDKVIMLQLTKSISNEIGNSELKKIVELLKQDNIDGIIMVDTPEKFRFIQD